MTRETGVGTLPCKVLPSPSVTKKMMRVVQRAITNHQRGRTVMINIVGVENPRVMKQIPIIRVRASTVEVNILHRVHKITNEQYRKQKVKNKLLDLLFDLKCVKDCLWGTLLLYLFHLSTVDAILTTHPPFPYKGSEHHVRTCMWSCQSH